MIPNESNITSLLPAEQLIEPRSVTTRNGTIIDVKGAKQEEIKQVEEMVRNCASNGDGFNLDEFCPNEGHFIHKFIREPKVVVATDQSGNIKGAAIC